MSNASDIDLTDNNLNANSFLYSLADTLDQLNQQIKNDTTLTIDNIPKALTIIETAKDLFKELKEVELYEDVNLLNDLQDTVNTLKDSLETLINNVQTKLDNNEFKGDRGVSISNIENLNNNLIITDTENNKYDLGNYVNDYNNLLNKPIFDYNFEKVISYNDSEVFDLISLSEIPKGLYICSVYFTSAGYGGQVYSCSSVFLLNYRTDSNQNSYCEIPFTVFAHALNNREMFFYSHFKIGRVAPSISFKINESADDVSFQISFKRFI